MSMLSDQDLGIAYVGDVTDLQRATSQAGGVVDGFARKAKTDLKGVTDEAKRTDDGFTRLANGIRSAFVGSSIAVGLITLKNQVMSVTGALTDAQVQLDRLTNGFRFGAGSAEAGAKEMAFVRSEADRLGLSLGSTAAQYMKMVAASRGNSMEGEKTRNLFKAISEASVVMGMSQDQTERAMAAVVQMMSKGKVMAEELRGQLGEHLPGAFSIAARAMNMTEVELNKLMETGGLLADEFLPRFSDQLRKVLSGTLEQSTLSMQANLNRLSTAWLDFKQQLVQGGIGDAISTQTKTLATEVSFLGDVLEMSRQRGDGFWETMGNAAGAATGRVAFQLLNDSIHLVGEAIGPMNLGLSEAMRNFDAIPDNLKPVAEQMALTTEKIKQAEVEYATLAARLAQAPDNIYIKSELANLARYIGTLRLAQQEQKKLMGQGGGSDVLGSVGSGDAALARAQRAEYDRQKAAADAAMRKYATPQEKLAEELKAQRAALGDLFTPELEKRITDSFVKPNKEGAKAARAAAKEVQDFYAVYNKINAKDVGVDASFYKDLDTLKGGYLAGRISVEQYQASVLSLVGTQKIVTDAAKAEADAVIAAAQSRNAAFDDEFEAIERKRLANEAQIKTGREMLEQIQFETSLLGMNTQQREEATAMRELERAGVVRGTQAYEAYAEALKKAIGDRREQQQMLDFWEEVDGTAKDLVYDLATGGEDAFKRWGEALEREVYNMLWQMTARKWIFQISGMDVGGGGGTDWISMASKAYDWYTGGASGAAAASAYSGYAAAGGSYAASAVGDAAVVSYGSSAAAGSSSSWLSAVGGYAALVAVAVAVADNLYSKGYNREAVGQGSGSTTTFGYSSYTSDPNMGASTAYNIGIENFTRGLYDWIGISEKWSDILSGTVRFAHMFGGKLNEVGLEADIAGGSASVSGYAEYDGGLFRSDKTVGIDVDPRDAAALDAQVEAVISGTKMMARAMGLSEEAINAYTGSLQVNFKGADTAQEQAERLATAMSDLQYSLLKAASGGQLAREEFERMTAEALAAAESAGISAQSISDVLINGMMNRLGGPETGAQMADLIAGGIIQSLAQNYTAQVAQMFMSQIITPVFTAMMAGVPISQAISQASIDGMVAYAQNAAATLNAMINSDEMRAAFAMIGEAAASVGESFGSIPMPSFGGTYELAAATAAVDEAAQAAAEAEAERYSIETELLNLLGKTTELRARELAEIDASNQALQQQVWALEDSRTALDSAFDALQRAMDAENERIEEQLQAASDSESALRDIFDTLGDSISSLQGEVTATTLMQAETARALLRDAINTGLLPEAESLADWIDAATGGLSAVRYTSAVEQELATLRLSAELQALQDIAEPQLSAAEEAVVVLEAQLEANELLLQTAQEQYEVAVGTYEATVSVVDGINGLHTAMAEYSALIAAGNASVIDFLTAPPEAYSGGSSGGGYSSGGSSGGSSSSGSWTAEGYWSKNPDLQAEFANANLANSPDFNKDPALSAELEYATWHWNTFGKTEGRKFAKGGAFTNGIVSRPTLFDMGLMGEASPEAIMPLANIGGSLGVRAVGGGSDDETKALLRQLIAEIQAARAGELFSIAKSAARTNAAIERVSGKGNSIAVRTLEGETVTTEPAA